MKKSTLDIISVATTWVICFLSHKTHSEFLLIPMAFFMAMGVRDMLRYVCED